MGFMDYPIQPNVTFVVRESQKSIFLQFSLLGHWFCWFMINWSVFSGLLWSIEELVSLEETPLTLRYLRSIEAWYLNLIASFLLGAHRLIYLLNVQICVVCFRVWFDFGCFCLVILMVFGLILCLVLIMAQLSFIKASTLDSLNRYNVSSKFL